MKIKSFLLDKGITMPEGWTPIGTVAVGAAIYVVAAWVDPIVHDRQRRQPISMQNTRKDGTVSHFADELSESNRRAAEESLRRLEIMERNTEALAKLGPAIESERQDDALDSADAALDELLSRGGFDSWWDELDDSLQTEVRHAIARRIRETW